MEMKNYVRLFFLFCVALYTCQSSAFLLSSECPAPSPCTCSGSSGSDIYIYCHSKSLTAMPQIAQYNTTVNFLYIQLNANSLTSVPDNAFRNLSSIHASSIDMQMQSNHINMIGNDAFKGVENITSLQLSSNNLTTIPFAISKLTHLQTLYIYGNPLRSIDPSVMPNIGGTLKTLGLDLGGFTEWPVDLHYLRTLQGLIVEYIPFSHLDTNAFRGFESTLLYLRMNYPKLEKVPYAICRLTHLTQFTFRYASNLKENRSSIFEPCGHTLPTVTSLHIEANYLHNFPDVFSFLPSLTDLGVGLNMFQYIENAVIPSTSHLITIDLNQNWLERIPSALNKLKSLQTLDLRYNKIRSIESADLYGLSNLRTLYLYYNPLAYIETDAFSHNPSLYELQLQHTQIDHVPQAIIGLSNLRKLILDPTACTCEMSDLKHWNVSAVTEFSTQCAYPSETIKTFVMTSLQSCPDA